MPRLPDPRDSLDDEFTAEQLEAVHESTREFCVIVRASRATGNDAWAEPLCSFSLGANPRS